MRINKLELENFRCFEKYQITLSDRFTLLIGDNGSGKTATLDAIKLALIPFINEVNENHQAMRLDSDQRYELSVKGQNPIKLITGNTVVNIDVIFNGRPNKFSLQSSFWVGHDTVLQLEISDILSNDKPLPIISYYGTDRLWKTKPTHTETIGPFYRSIGYTNCLNSSFDLTQLFSWFKTQELAALQKQQRRHVLEAVRAAIISMIPDAKRVWWDLDWDEILFESTILGTSQIIPIHLLSDGYRNMLGMVADIAYRMATLNPQLEADVINQTEGIVLIDEIDLHLHPKWQRQVVDRLLKTFPKVQFIASSHSPFIIQSLYQRDDVLLWDLDSATALTVDSKSIEDIAENQQGVEIPQQSQRFLDMEKAAEEYYRVLKQIPAADEQHKQQLRQQLDELLLPYSDDPAYQAFLKMERLAVENSKDA